MLAASGWFCFPVLMELAEETERERFVRCAMDSSEDGRDLFWEWVFCCARAISSVFMDSNSL